MAATKKPYEQFGSYILFKKMETDALGDLWRAGRIDGNAIGATVALRRLSGGNREAFVQAAEHARAIAPLLTGTSFGKNQVVDIVNGVPFVAHEYAGGRSLRHIVDRARGGNGITPNPVPIDQAIVIAERVALSLATSADMKFQGNRLNHGALLPQFVWISDDGEIRVAGQQLGRAFAASLKEPKFAAEFARYAAPELIASGEPSKSSEVFSLGALLFLLVSGIEPPEALSGSAFANAVLAAKTTTGQPIADDIRAILGKSLVLDPAARYASVADMKAALSALVHGGKYSATTFNLAFYLSSLLKKELEGEALERDKESKLNLTYYIDAPTQPVPIVAATAVPAADSGPMFMTEEPKRSKAPLAIAAAVIIAVIGGAAFVMMGKKSAQPSAQPALASAVAVPAAPAKPRVISQPILATPTTTAATATLDPDAQKKAFEDAVAQKMQEEMMKLQADYTHKLQQQQAKNAPVLAAPPAPVPQQAATRPQVAATRPQVPEERSPSAAALDEQRRQTAIPAPAQTASQAPALPVPQPQQSAPAPAVAAAPSVREGDVVDVRSLDSIPQPLSPIRPQYPMMARAQRIEGTIILTALISEAGQVLDVRVLRGDARMGLDDAAIRAIRGTRFSIPMKDGKRVKTWFPQTVQFKL
jgi:protein TonB